MLFTKGSKFRETKNISWEKDKYTIIDRFSDCIDTWCRKYGIDESVLIEWKGEVIDKDDHKIKNLSNKTYSKFTSAKQSIKYFE